jgi:hypothetical protein
MDGEGNSQGALISFRRVLPAHRLGRRAETNPILREPMSRRRKRKKKTGVPQVVCTRQRKQTVDGFESAELVSTPRPVQVETSRRLISFNDRCMGTWACQLQSSRAVIDNRSQNMHPARRFRAGVRPIFLVSFTVFSCGLALVVLRLGLPAAKSESLMAGLKSFPFASAGFSDVRELAIHHGGTAVQQFPPFTIATLRRALPRLGRGKVRIPRIPAGPICTAQDCTFEIWTKTRLARLPLERRAAELLYTALPYLGIRSWILYSGFGVSGGKLEGSRTTVGEERRRRSGSYLQIASSRVQPMQKALEQFESKLDPPRVPRPPRKRVPTEG